MLPGSQRQRRVTKEETLSQTFGSPQTNHGAGAATPAAISDHPVSQSDCLHTRELPSTALECNEPGCRRESHSWGTLPSSVGTSAAGGSEVVVGSSWAGQSEAPKPLKPPSFKGGAFLRIPSTEGAGCLPLQQGWPGEPWGWQYQVSPGDGSAR